MVVAQGGRLNGIYLQDCRELRQLKQIYDYRGKDDINLIVAVEKNKTGGIRLQNCLIWYFELFELKLSRQDLKYYFTAKLLYACEKARRMWL
jgi:hypothetical protein